MAFVECTLLYEDTLLTHHSDQFSQVFNNALLCALGMMHVAREHHTAPDYFIFLLYHDTTRCTFITFSSGNTTGKQFSSVQYK